MIKCEIITEYIENKTFFLKGYKIKIHWKDNLQKRYTESFYPRSKNIYYNLLPNNN